MTLKARVERRPVKPEVASSSLVGPAARWLLEMPSVFGPGLRLLTWDRDRSYR